MSNRPSHVRSLLYSSSRGDVLSQPHLLWLSPLGYIQGVRNMHLPYTIAVIGAGAMGSAVGRRLYSHGATVLTFVDGRSENTRQRAQSAGMTASSLPDIAAADLILSIVPPAEALAVARLLAPVLRETASKAAFIDFNAINPDTMKSVQSVISAANCDVIDGSVIGGPPKPDSGGPSLYVSGSRAYRAEILSGLGLKLKRIDGDVGAASALKMVYAGLNKGLIGLGATMLLGASRSGSAESLIREMEESVPDLLNRFEKSVPDMYPKAYRWVAEMKEIAEFLGPDDPGHALFTAMSAVFERIAADERDEKTLSSTMNQVLALIDRN